MTSQRSRFEINNSRTEKILIAVAVLFHVAISGFPLVNLEWAFSDAALYFTNREHVYIDQYFEYQANTLGVPFLTAFFAKILPFIDIQILPRILSAVGFIFLGQALLKMNRMIQTNIPGYIILLVVFLNPLLWTFGGRGTADFLPAALGLFGLALFWEQKDFSVKKYVAIAILGFAITLKYHAVLLLVPLVVEILLRPTQKIKTAVWQSVITIVGVLIIPCLYILLVRQKLGFWLTPPLYLERHKLNLSDFLTNFSIYFGYLALVLLPFSISSVFYFIRHLQPQKRLKSLVTFVLIGLSLFALGYGWLRPHGEMNFGPLDGIVSPAISGGGFMILTLVLVVIIYQAIEKIDFNWSGLTSFRYVLCMVLGIVAFLFILSFTRPTQRYLMFILPFAYLILLPRVLGNRMIIYSSIVMYAVMNFFLLGNQYATGSATQMMVNELRKKGMVEKTEGGAINAHAGNVFFRYRQLPKEYVVVSGEPVGALFTVKSGFIPMAKKTYSLVVFPQQ